MALWRNLETTSPMSRLSQLVRSFPLQLGVPLAVAGLLTAACGPPAKSAAGGSVKTEPRATTTTTTSTTTTAATPVEPMASSSGDPTDVLVGLRVAPEGPRTGYKREL